jgi:hypothetical protein
MFEFRKLSYVVPGAADLGDIIPTVSEMTIHNSNNLLAWIRASVNLDPLQSIRDRSRGILFTQPGRAGSTFPPVAESAAYDDKPYCAFDPTDEMEMRSTTDILPATGAFTFAWVGHWSADAGGDQSFFASNGANASQTFRLGIDGSTQRIELKLSENISLTTGVSSWTPTDDLPFLAIVGYDPDATTLRIRVNRGESDVTNAAATAGSIAGTGGRRRLQLGISGGDDFGLATELWGGGIAEMMLFTGYAFSDDAMIDAIETVLGDRYGFAAP